MPAIICSKLIIKTPERRQWHRSGVSIVDFEKVNADWVSYFKNSAKVDFCSISVRACPADWNLDRNQSLYYTV